MECNWILLLRHEFRNGGIPVQWDNGYPGSIDFKAENLEEALRYVLEHKDEGCDWWEEDVYADSYKVEYAALTDELKQQITEERFNGIVREVEAAKEKEKG